jgi:hypothetical protein
MSSSTARASSSVSRAFDYDQRSRRPLQSAGDGDHFQLLAHSNGPFGRSKVNLQCDLFSEWHDIVSVGGTLCHIGASASAIAGQNILLRKSVRATPAVTAKWAMLAAAVRSEERNGFHRRSRFWVDLL